MRLMSGARDWPDDISFRHAIRRTIRSLISDIVDRRKQAVETLSADMPHNGEEESAYVRSARSFQPSPDDVVHGKRLLEKIVEIFRNDPICLDVLFKQKTGWAPVEIQKKLGLAPRRSTRAS